MKQARIDRGMLAAVRQLMRSPAGQEPALEVTLRPFRREDDLPLLSTWLSRGHVARWWGEPDQVLDEFAARDRDTATLIVLADQPVGILCWQTPSRSELEAAGLADLPGDLIDVDILIGEPRALGRGVGPAALLQLFERLSIAGVPLVGLATSVANTRALAAFEQVGLVPYRDFLEAGGQYRYFTKRLSRAV
jgi:aminoglycoside 6'-N-acetyltransferase